MMNLSQLPNETKDYQIHKELGDGAFAQVFLATSKATKEQVALKIIDVERLVSKEKNPELKKIKTTLLDAEVENNRRCQSKHIVKYCDVLKNEKYRVLVLEFCNQGTLFDKIQREKCLPEPEATRLLSHLIRGFAELHKNKIIHRDLKTENILIHDDVYKIADLGISKGVSNLLSLDKQTILGTKVTMAPQVLWGHQYTFSADIWSLGVIYYEALTGRIPFKNISEEEVQRVNRSIRQLPISNESKQLLKSLFVIDPTKRLRWVDLYRMYNDHTGVFSLRTNSKLNQTMVDMKSFKDQRQKPSQLAQSSMDFQPERQEQIPEDIDNLKLQRLKLNLIKVSIIQRTLLDPLEKKKRMSKMDAGDDKYLQQYQFSIWIQIRSLLDQSKEFFMEGKLNRSKKQSPNSYVTLYNDVYANMVKEVEKVVLSENLSKKNQMLFNISGSTVEHTKEISQRLRLGGIETFIHEKYAALVRANSLQQIRDFREMDGQAEDEDPNY